MADCEKFNCGCDDIANQINSYNAALDNLANDPSLVNFEADLQEALKGLYENKLQKLKYEPGPDASERPCNACGNCAELKSLLRRTLGTKKANAMINCCSPAPHNPNSDICAEINNAFGTANSSNNPCGQDADDQKSANLIPCNPFAEYKPDYITITLPKIKCVKNPNTKCEDKNILSLTQEGEVTIKIPDVSILSRDISDLDLYISNVSKALSYAKDGTGGAASSLKTEACLVTLLNLMCENKIKGKPGEGQLYGRGCIGAMKALGCSGTGQGYKYAEDLCDQLKTDLAWGHTLTYGHMGTGIDGCPDNGVWKTPGVNNNKENDIPQCGNEERIRYREQAFLAPGQDQKDAIASRLNELRANFPNGCGTPNGWNDPTNNPNLRAETEGQAGNGVIVVAECVGGAAYKNKDGEWVEGPCPCAPVNSITKEQAEEVAALQRPLADKEIQIRDLRRKISEIDTELELLKNPRGDQHQRKIQLEAEKQEMALKITNLGNEVTELQQKIKAITDPKKNGVIGKCIEFQASYCPANSTPKRSTNQGNAGNPNNGGKGKTREKEYNHSNFYDMLRNLISETTFKNPCQASPLAAQLNDCFGGQTGKNPFGDVFGGDDSGPTLRPGGKGEENDGSPCSDNDGVDQIQSSGPCRGGEESDDSFRQNMSRNRCVTRLNNIAQGLNKALRNSGLVNNPVSKNMDYLSNAVSSLRGMIEGIQPPSGDPSCADFSLDNEIKAIQNIQKKMKTIKNGFDRFKL